MKRAALVLSLALNVVLIGLLIWLQMYARDLAFRTIAEATDAEVRLQAHVLAQLDADPPQLDEAKAFLKRNIEQGKDAVDLWDASR